ncbi:MAG: hypothetical protein KGS72_02695 [Cyanobacteria bacterium REEB67]|nr:hypothetical protein [Cyanobacteria bacterium REEB67]
MVIWTAFAILVSGPALAYTIEGKVEHVESLPAVERKFSPGVEFDQSLELSPDNIWIKVPSWLAGVWSARQETMVFRRDFRSGKESSERRDFKAKQDFTYGQQADKSGQVWHYLGVPYTSKSTRSQAIEIHEVKEKQLVQGGSDEVTFRAVATVILVDDFTSRIKRTYQQESLTSYQPIAEDRLSMTASTKVFDAQGQPQTLQENEAIIKRARRFQPIDRKDGKDLKGLFRQFLIAKGLGDLVVD